MPDDMDGIGANSTEVHRAGWMGIMARCHREDLDEHWPKLGQVPRFEWLRPPQTGLVMVRGRAGGSGIPFNLGEMTVTRCALRLEGGVVGHGYAAGRDRQLAERAAILDALLQLPDRRDELLAAIVEPLRLQLEERSLEARRKAATTKVEFFTMVRAEK